MLKKNSASNISDKKNVRADQIVYMDNPSLFLRLFCSAEPMIPPAGNLRTVSRKKRIFRIILVLVTVGMGVGVSKAARFPVFVMEKLTAEGKSACFATSDSHLKTGYSENISPQIAAESFAKAVTEKGWADRIREGRFDEAENILSEHSVFIQEHPEHKTVLALFEWIADMEKYFSGRSPESPLIIFCDEYRIESLLSVWEKNKTEFRSLLRQTGEQDIPGLAQDRIYQCLEILRNRYTLYVKDIQIFKEKFLRELEDNPSGNPLSLIEEFRKRHPGIGGMEELYTDTANYMKIKDAVKNQQWNEAEILLQSVDFNTDFFIHEIELLKKDKMSGKTEREVRQTGTDADQKPVHISELIIIPADADENRAVALRASKFDIR